MHSPKQTRQVSPPTHPSEAPILQGIDEGMTQGVCGVGKRWLLVVKQRWAAPVSLLDGTSLFTCRMCNCWNKTTAV